MCYQDKVIILILLSCPLELEDQMDRKTHKGLDLLLECSCAMMLLGQHVIDSGMQHTEAGQLPVFYLSSIQKESKIILTFTWEIKTKKTSSYWST